MHLKGKPAALFLAAMAATAATPLMAQSPHVFAPKDQVIAIKAGHLFDSKTGTVLNNQVVLIRGDRVDNDAAPALAAGMVAVHIRRGPWGYLQEPPEGALRIRSLDELPEVLP